MKGFIEVTNSLDAKFTIQIKHIICFGDTWIETLNSSYETRIKESYEEIKELIKNAQ